MLISVNGNLTDSESYHIDPLSEPLMYGAGLFETIRYDHKTPYFLTDHLIRMRQSAELLGINMKISEETLMTWIREMIAVSGDNGVLKINLLHCGDDSTVMISRRENHYTPDQYQQGFRIRTSLHRRNERSLLVSMKTMNYYENILELRKAKSRGFNEVLFLNTKDFLAECSLSNLFFVKDEVIHTPTATCGLLSGIMRGKVIELAQKIGIPLEEGYYLHDALFDADEVFITNSVMEIMSVRSIDDSKQFPVIGKITKELMDMFEDAYRIHY